jgi:hypothetical protein
VEPTAVVGHSNGEIRAAVSEVAVLYALLVLTIRASMLAVRFPLLMQLKLPTIKAFFFKNIETNRE